MIANSKLPTIQELSFNLRKFDGKVFEEIFENLMEARKPYP